MSLDQESQLASSVLMLRPANFFDNPLTAGSNAFQGNTAASRDEQHRAAVREFDGLVAALENAGVTVVVVDDTPEPVTPDAIFPNNWISTHADGTVVLYPMEAANRRTERRNDIVELLGGEKGYRVSRVIDLSAHERQGRHLEGTGSLVLDRVNHIAYACLSSRTHLDAVGDFAQQLDYDVVAFDAVDRAGIPIYHTNVMMSVGQDLAILCDEAIRDEDQRTAVIASLEITHHDTMSLSYAQMEAFAGNMLELVGRDGNRVLAMSASAKASLTAEQREIIERRMTIVSAPIDNIEQSAGGSVRCMLAEIHLPVQDAQ